MENLPITAQEVPIGKSSVVPTFFPGPPTSDSGEHIPSIHYSGPLYNLPERNLGGDNSHNIKFGIPLSVSSSPPPGHGGIDRIAHNYTPIVIEGSEYFRTSNNVFRFPVNDKANLPHWEESDSLIGPWKAVAEENIGVGYSRPAKFEGIIVAAQDVMVDPQLNRYVTPILAYSGHLNELGANLSRVFNIRFMRSLYEASIEHEILTGASKSYGYKQPIKEVGYGVGFLPERAAAAVTGKGIFLANKNLSRIVREWAQAYDVPEHIVLAYLNIHEGTHLLGVEGEGELELIIEKGFEKAAGNERNPSRKTGYSQIAGIANQRGKDVFRNYGGKSLIKSSLSPAMEKSAEMYAREALEMGVEDVKGYVEARLMEEYQAVSNASNENSKDSEGKASGTLESRIKDKGEIEVPEENIIELPDTNKGSNGEKGSEPEPEAEMDKAA